MTIDTDLEADFSQDTRELSATALSVLYNSDYINGICNYYYLNYTFIKHKKCIIIWIGYGFYLYSKNQQLDEIDQCNETRPNRTPNKSTIIITNQQILEEKTQYFGSSLSDWW